MAGRAIVYLLLAFTALALYCAPVLPDEFKPSVKMKLTITILICPDSIADRALCQPDTASDVINGPNLDNERMCGLFGQSTIAPTAIAPRPGEYIKIKCERKPK